MLLSVRNVWYLGCQLVNPLRAVFATGISSLLGVHGTQILLVVHLYSSTSEPFENIACYCVGVGHMMAY